MDVPRSVLESEIFAGLSPLELQDVVALASVRSLADGDVVCAEGEPGDGLYVIAEGAVSVRQDVGPIPRELATLGPGDVVGEMALLSDSPRSADAIAVGPCVLYRFGRAEFIELLEGQDPAAYVLLYGLAKVLCERLRSAANG